MAPLLASCSGVERQADRPNVIIVLTDDQGIGGLSCHDNPYLKTPCLDNFYEESVRMTDFHVSSVSTPTRGAIISGRYPIRNGAWATFKGRDILSRTSPTIAELFRDGGYSTAMFGKWHLGDNYPSRAVDCGFDYVVNHRAGGVGELSDYWGNNYFNDTYWVNEVPQEFEGYCTDVWFEQTQKYIETQRDSDKPFFIYLATNAPHGPHYVEEKYSAPYQSLEDEGIVDDAGFYGQIANLDENFGRLDNYLKSNGLDKNTIVIFLTDNGAWAKDNTWVYGYSGAKGSKLEGGHRVPFFIRWADGGISGGRDISALTGHVDMLPTLAALCGIELPAENKFDGVDFSPLLIGGDYDYGDRTLFIHNRQDSKPPMDIKNACVASGDWRLLDGDKLYDLKSDQLEKRNIAKDHPELMERLLAENAAFIEKTKGMVEYQEFIPVVAGAPQQKIAILTIQHAIGKSAGLWEAEQVCEGIRVDNDTYSVDFTTSGKYRISVARWPRECQGDIWGIPSVNPKSWYTYETIHPEAITLEVGGECYTKNIVEGMKEADFEVDIKAGQQLIEVNYVEGGEVFGAYYTYIEKI